MLNHFTPPLTQKRFEPTEDRIDCKKTVIGPREMKLTFTNRVTDKQIEIICDPEQPNYISKAKRTIMKEIWRD